MADQIPVDIRACSNLLGHWLIYQPSRVQVDTVGTTTFVLDEPEFCSTYITANLALLQ